jgi:polygalacturonase
MIPRMMILVIALVLPQSGMGSPLVDITNHGAIGDGKTLNTKALQAAVDHCAAQGGGTVAVPPGSFLTGSVELKSNITLSLSPGAVLRGSDKLEDYPPLAFRHNELGQTRSLLWAMNQSDIRITGDGTIDLNDGAFFDFNQYRSNLTLSSGVELDQRQRQETEASLARPRPTQPIFFHRCQRLHVDGVTIRNAPCWTITFSVCRDIQVSHLTVANNLRTGNCDGLHFCGSKNATITDCIFSCGDDCIAVTGITAWEEVAENFVVANCIMTSRSAALRLGHQASKVRNVAVNNLVIRDTNRGFAIFARDNGWVENVRIQNVVMETRMFAGGWWGKGEPLVLCAAGSGRIQNISVSNVRAESENGILVIGQQNNIRDVELRDWSLTLRYGRNRPLFKPLFDLSPMPALPSPDPKLQIPWLYAADVQGLRVANVRCTRADGDADFSIDPVTAGVDHLEFTGCHPCAKQQLDKN